MKNKGKKDSWRIKFEIKARGIEVEVMRKIGGFISTIIGIAAIVLIALTGGAKLIGYTPYAITSGSMIPEYPVGSIVYVKDVEPDMLQVGDDVSFYLEEDVVATHRIREINNEERYIRTYGIHNKDSNGNQINDANPVDFDCIIGRVEGSLPIVGYVYLFVGTTTGKIVVLSVVGMIIICELLNFILRRRR